MLCLSAASNSRRLTAHCRETGPVSGKTTSVQVSLSLPPSLPSSQSLSLPPSLPPSLPLIGVYAREPFTHVDGLKLQIFTGWYSIAYIIYYYNLHYYTYHITSNSTPYVFRCDISQSCYISFLPPPPLLASFPPSLPGHKGAVRSLAVADNESYFVSSSKDRTVKIWNLRNHGDGKALVPCRLVSKQRVD